LLAEAGYPDGFETKIYYRNVARSYVPLPKNVVEDLQTQLKENLNIDAEIVEMESSAFLMAVASGQLDGIYLLGWEAGYPDQTDFLDYHFGENASAQFGDKFDDITENLAKAAQLANDAERGPYYTAANNAIKLHIPMIPIAWSGSGMAYKAAVEGVNASPMNDEKFVDVSIPGQDTFIWMQDAEPASLYCPDETDSQSLRACGQIVEALYGYQIGSAAVEPVLAEKCEPDADLTEWTCTLRRGVKFHDGSTLDANDVVTSFVVQWDASDSLHSGNKGTFTNFSNFFGSFLNVPNK
jgi:peptide/nickel transport system substrate-binding protein